MKSIILVAGRGTRMGAITLGIGMTNFHSVDEYIEVADLQNMARYVEAIIAEYAM